MKHILPLLAVTAVALAGCPGSPTVPALTADGKNIPVSGKILSGSVQGDKLSPQSKVALIGAFKDANGAKVDALGRALTNEADPILSVPVKEGKYAIDLPAPPTGVGEGSFVPYLYNDKNDNNRIDEGEDKTKGNDGTLVFYPVLGYQVVNPKAGGLDTFSMTKFNLLFN